MLTVKVNYGSDERKVEIPKAGIQPRSHIERLRLIAIWFWI